MKVFLKVRSLEIVETFNNIVYFYGLINLDTLDRIGTCNEMGHYVTMIK